MNFVYYKFLFINTLKRKPIWITWFLFLFTCTCFIIILPLVAKMNTLQVWANTTMAVCQTFMGMVASLFTAVLAINIFKDTNEEGTELIVISKPITRFKIVLTKFFVFGTYCLMINLSAVFLSAFTIFLPRTEPQFYGGLILSMFIGNAITFMVFGSISILLSVNFAKMGIIITNIIISLIFLIYQTLTLFVFSTPIRELDSKKMSAPSYIVLDRKEDGSYKEREVVRFTPSEIPEGQTHPCQATNWQEMKEFWEHDIKSHDPTTILNATDWAGQLGLTYMSYKTNEYAERQANRMFGISRFYDYQLTSPASPEIIAGVDNKQTLNWIYTDFTSYVLLPDIVLPSAFGFAGIEPLTGTRLRGYTNKIPVGSMRSKKLLFSTETYLEQNDWTKYQDGFDEMYEKVLDYHEYTLTGMDYYQYTSAFGATNGNIRTYYDLVWQYLMGKEGAHNYDIKTVNDLNTRFIQFKNYCYWKALGEQQQALTEIPTFGPVYESWLNTKGDVQTALVDVAVTLSDSSWMMLDDGDPTKEVHLLGKNTQAPCYDWLQTAWTYEKEHATEGQEELGVACPLSIVLKTAQVFNTIVYAEENWMYSSLETSTRNSDFSGRAYAVKDTWYPNIKALNMPLGQNIQYFFYKITPKVQYWEYAIIWAVISMCAFAAGAVVYNKYDVK